jgi:hypothetical protein
MAERLELVEEVDSVVAEEGAESESLSGGPESRCLLSVSEASVASIGKWVGNRRGGPGGTLGGTIQGAEKAANISLKKPLPAETSLRFQRFQALSGE